MKRGDQVWWRQWQGTIVGYEPTNRDSVHVDLHTHKTEAGHVERHRYFDLVELSPTPPAGAITTDVIPPIPEHPLRGHVLDTRPPPKEPV